MIQKFLPLLLIFNHQLIDSKKYNVALKEMLKVTKIGQHAIKG